MSQLKEKSPSKEKRIKFMQSGELIKLERFMQHLEKVLNIEKDELVKDEDKKKDKILPTTLKSIPRRLLAKNLLSEIRERNIE